MTSGELHVVTGAFGYTGRYIAKRLLAEGHDVRTLTNSPDRANPFAGAVDVRPLAFADQEALASALVGAKALYNTYWVRFDHRDFCQARAVEDTLRLFDAAKLAGVERVVHTSITNPSLDSDLAYFHGKAQLEKGLADSRLSHAILRPTVLFGPEDILVHNIAWCLRRFPFFPVFGDGSYRLQPMHVDDFAELAVREGASDEDVTIDAIGPETFTYREFVETIGAAIGKKRRIVSVPNWLGHALGYCVGMLVGDVLLTRDEITGLCRGLLSTDSPPAGQTRFSDWVRDGAGTLGKRYTSELGRRRNRKLAYGDL